MRTECTINAKKLTPQYKYFRNSFYILIMIGLATLILGVFLKKLDSIGSGLIGGGTLIILWSLIYTAQYWLTLGQYFKLLALAVVLLIMIAVAYKKMDKPDKPSGPTIKLH